MDSMKLIQEAVKSIQETDSMRKQIIDKLVPIKKERLSGKAENLFSEQSLVFPVQEIEFTGKISGVDSGFVPKSLFSLDLVLVRAVAAIFEYENSIIKNSNYLPNFFSFPKPHLSNNALQADEFQSSQSIIRLNEELSFAKKSIKEFSPKFCFLDGSLIPQYVDKPRKDSKVAENYHSLINNFQELYEIAEENNCVLLGAVEDSRGSRFRSLVQDSFIEKFPLLKKLDSCFDSVLLDYLLETKERSSAFTYTNSIKEHPILNDFDSKWAEQVHAFYLKPVEFDRPLRIEFLHKPKELTEFVNEISSVVLFQSSAHREYAYPNVLIEADFRAGLKPNEIDVVYDKIVDKLGKKFKMKLRRDSRPF